MVGHTEVIAKNGALSHRQLPSGCGHALYPQSPSGLPTAIRRSPSQVPLESSTIVKPVAIGTPLIIFCFALPAHIARPISHRPSQFSSPAFFYLSFFWALLQANSCVPQLRVFCFPGSA